MHRYSSQIISNSGQDPAQAQLKHEPEIQFRRAVNFRGRYEGANDLFWQSDGSQMVILCLGWIPIELPFPKSTRSSANSSRIKSYDCLTLTLLFQSRNDFVDFIQDWKRICDQIYKMALTHAQYQLKRVHRNQDRCTRSPKPGAHSLDARISGVHIAQT